MGPAGCDDPLLGITHGVSGELHRSTSVGVCGDPPGVSAGIPRLASSVAPENRVGVQDELLTVIVLLDVRSKYLGAGLTVVPKQEAPKTHHREERGSVPCPADRPPRPADPRSTNWRGRAQLTRAAVMATAPGR